MTTIISAEMLFLRLMYKSREEREIIIRSREVRLDSKRESDVHDSDDNKGRCGWLNYYLKRDFT